MDNDILLFLKTVKESEDVTRWKYFYFTEYESGLLRPFKIRNLGIDLNFLDRIKVGPYSGTLIGIYNKRLYVNLDIHTTAIVCSGFVKDYSNMTQFKSDMHFRHIFLGFYIMLQKKYYNEFENIELLKNENDFLKYNRTRMFLMSDISFDIIQSTKLWIKLIEFKKPQNFDPK